MRNYELIKAIYDRCPDMAKYPKEYSIDQIFDRTQDIIDMIERERPEIVKASNQYNNYPEKLWNLKN